MHRLLDDGGRLLAEVVDDVVHGRWLREETSEPVWRQWEVELGEDPRSVLDAAHGRLLSAGATVSGSASKLGWVLPARRRAGGGPGGRAATC